MKWEYTDYRPEGFECWEAKWGRFYSIAVAKIGESRIIVGFTERGNITRILMYDEEEQ